MRSLEWNDRSLDECVDAAKGGDRRAFEEIYRRLNKRIAHRLAYLLGPGTTVEDLLQETFLRAYRKLSSFRGQCPFEHWLVRIAGNLAASHYRKRSVRNLLLWQRAEAVDDVPSPGALVDSVYPDLRAVYWGLSGLSSRLRETIVLFELEGLTLAEIAKELGISVNTAASRLRRGRAKLRKRLEELGYQPMLRSSALISGEIQ
jgi:RNA polymerase sigma-70 factor, ECF subfamily